jgi:phage shock protein A
MRRLSATLFSQVDRAVSEIENHDAIIEAAIRDHQRALAKAKVRFNRLKADGGQLHRRLDELKSAEAQWTERAKDQARKDEQTALKCLQRRRECQTQIERIEASLDDHQQAEQRLSREIGAMESRVKEINAQRNLMRTRQSTADAMRIFKSLEGCCDSDMDSTFEKWEVKVMEAELASGEIGDVDSLEQQFLAEEETSGLKAELDALLDDEEKSHDH